MKSEILRLLKESNTYISGQQLCEQFQVSRTAVWKVIDQLKKEGYQIEAVRNKGYRLIDSPDVMSKAEIESLMDTKWAGSNVVYYDEIDSTNNRAKEAGDNKAPHGTLFVADMQVAGKGRRGRVLKMELGKQVKRSELIAAIMKSFEKDYEIFVKTEDLSGLQELYNSMLVNLDRDVKVLEPGNEYEAHALGINKTGELIVRTAEGEEKEIYAGEVSVRGVYGYV